MAAQIVVIMGSDSDLKIVCESGMSDIFDYAGAKYTAAVLSAHRHKGQLAEYCREKLKDGVQVFIGIAGMAAALPGEIAAVIQNQRPVIGVALSSSDCQDGMDALLSMTRLPAGTAVGCTGVNKAGLINAAIQACQIVALTGPGVANRLIDYVADRSRSKPPLINISLKNS